MIEKRTLWKYETFELIAECAVCKHFMIKNNLCFTALYINYSFLTRIFLNEQSMILEHIFLYYKYNSLKSYYSHWSPKLIIVLFH